MKLIPLLWISDSLRYELPFLGSLLARGLHSLLFKLRGRRSFLLPFGFFWEHLHSFDSHHSPRLATLGPLFWGWGWPPTFLEVKTCFPTDKSLTAPIFLDPQEGVPILDDSKEGDLSRTLVFIIKEFFIKP